VWIRGLLGFLAGTSTGLVGAAVLGALKVWRDTKLFDPGALLVASLTPARFADAIDLIGSVLFGAVVGLAVAATLAARRQRPV
jgi:hypothetical protein